MLIYGGLLLAASTAFVISLSMRQGFTVDIIKDRGTLARQIANGYVENVYRLQVSNTTEQAQHYRVTVSGLPGLNLATPAQLDVAAVGIGSLPVRLTLAPEAAEPYRGRAHPIRFEISTTGSGESATRTEKSTFFVPR